MIGTKLHPRERRRLDAIQTASRLAVARKDDTLDVATIIADAMNLDAYVETGGETGAADRLRRGEIVTVSARLAIAAKNADAGAVVSYAEALDKFVRTGES